MMTRRGKSRRPRWIALLRLAWREGEGAERCFVAYIASSPLVALLAVVTIAILSGVSAGEAVWLGFVALGGIVAFPAFQGPIYDSAYSLGFVKATLSQDWMRQADRDYYTELLHYRSTLGAVGRDRGGLAWAFGYCVLYIGNVLAGALLMLALYPIFGSPIGLVVLLVETVAGIAAGIADSRPTGRLFRRADEQGFRLLELKR